MDATSDLFDRELHCIAMPAIEIHRATKRYGDRTAVRDLSLAVPEHCVFGLLGPNGAGKTTTMRLLLGLARPDAGRIRLLGRDLAGDRVDALARVGAFVERPALYEHLSGDGNLQLARRLMGLATAEVDRVLEMVDLRADARARVATYSLGMKQRLAVARALLGSPRLLLLDEPTNGLDPDGIVIMRELIRTLPERIGGTVFVSSHLLSEVEQTAGFAAIMVRGSVVLEGAVRDLLKGSAAVRIQVPSARRAADLLIAADFRVEDVESDGLTLLSDGEGEAARVAARANRILVQEGFDVHAMVPRSRSLEDLYRSTVKGTARC